MLSDRVASKKHQESHIVYRGAACIDQLRSTALCWCMADRNKLHTYQVIVEGGELKTLQCIITPFPSTAE